MNRILIAYVSNEGQTRKLAGFVAECLRANGHDTVLLDVAVDTGPLPPGLNGAIVGGPIHYGRHPPALARFLERHAAWLQTVPSAFFSVSLSVDTPDPSAASSARTLADKFLAQVGWRPTQMWLIAGALAYTQYGLFKRHMMRWIARRQGMATDTTRDHEYTNWDAVRRFVNEYLAALH